MAGASVTAQSAAANVRRDHFVSLIGNWSNLGPPLRPSRFDSALVQREGQALPARGRVVVLGLTPETVTCAWPGGTELIALDHSPAMLKALWPQSGAPERSRVLLANWLAMPLADGVADLVCADGCHTQVTFPFGFGVLAGEVHRVLKPAGRLLARVFVRPQEPESMQDIADALVAGRIGSVNALKLRLLAALHGLQGHGTRMGDAWSAWKELPVPPQVTLNAPGWTGPELAGIEGYRGLDTRYYLPTLAELRSVQAEQFDEVACHVGDYELAERCPTLIWQRKR